MVKFSKNIIIFIVAILMLPGFVLADLPAQAGDIATTCALISESNTGCPNLSSQDCRKLLEECSVYYEQQSEKIAQDISKTEQEKKTLNSQINSLKKKIQNLRYQINQGNIMVKDLNMQISDTQDSIEETSLEINSSQNQIANILRSIYEEDQKSSIIILLEGNLSDFFSNIAYLEGLNSKVSDLLESTKNLRAYLEAQKEKMDDEVGRLQKTIALQNLQKQENEKNRKEQEQYLKLTETQYQQQLKEKQETEQKSAKIRAMLFQMVGVAKAPTFGEALEVAKSVTSLINIRPAFLLAIISQESAIGRNVGQCVIIDTATGSGKRISTGASAIRVMKPTRDIPLFLQITAALGRNPYDTPVSCWIPAYVKGSPSGWGGAMGPAQFIPSTWNLYTDKLKNLLGTSADPWGIKDSFTAAALYLSDLGASAQTYAKESSAASRYYGGSSAYARSVMSRANCIQGFIDSGTMSTSCQDLIF